MEQARNPQMEWFMNPRKCPHPPPPPSPAIMLEIIIAFTDYFQGVENIIQQYPELREQYEELRNKLLEEIARLIEEDQKNK